MTLPREYDMSNPQEKERLLREVYGYLKVCVDEHHGTDFEGRRFALKALEKIITGKVIL